MPALCLAVEVREQPAVDRNHGRFALARLQSQLHPAEQAAALALRPGEQVQLGGFLSGDGAAVGNGKPRAWRLARRGRQLRVTESGVGEPEAERKQRLLAATREPAITDIRTLDAVVGIQHGARPWF